MQYNTKKLDTHNICTNIFHGSMHWIIISNTRYKRYVLTLGAPPSPLIAVPNVTAHPTTASVPTSYYSMCTIIPCAQGIGIVGFNVPLDTI